MTRQLVTDVDKQLAYLDLTQEVLRWVQQTSDQFLIAAVADMAVALEHLIPAVENCGGIVLDVRAIASSGVAAPVTDATFHEQIVAALAPAGSASPVKIRKDARNKYRAFYETDGHDDPTDDAVLGLATSLLDPACGQDGLLLVAYDEELLSATDVRRAWTFARSQFPTLVGATTRVVLVCAPGQFDYARLCGQPPTATFIINDGPCVQRNVLAQDENTVRYLAEGQLPEHLVLFLGAGFSVSSDLSLGNDLRDVALREFLNDNIMDRSRLAQEFYRALPRGRLLPDEVGVAPDELAVRLTLERVLREVYRRGPARTDAITTLENEHARALVNPGASVRHLREIVKTTRRKVVIVTVNVDCLIEDGHDAYVKVFADDAQFEEAEQYVSDYLSGTEQGIPLLKLHGTLGTDNSLVFNIDQTNAGLHRDRVKALTAATTPRHGGLVPLAYVGASMRDRDLTPLLAATNFIDRVDEYWIAPLPGGTVLDFWDRTQRRDRWNNQLHGRADSVSERCITLTADVAMEKLARHLLS